MIPERLAPGRVHMRGCLWTAETAREKDPRAPAALDNDRGARLSRRPWPEPMPMGTDATAMSSERVVLGSGDDLVLQGSA